MATDNILTQAASFTGTELRDMGAQKTDANGLAWEALDQNVGDNGVALSPNRESYRRYALKEEQKFAGKAALAVSGPGKGPSSAPDTMRARPVVKRLMNRLERRGLIPRGPHTYASLKKPAPQIARALKPAVSVTAVQRMSIDLLRAKREWFARRAGRAGLKLLASAALPEPAARIVSRAAMLLGPKPGRRSAYNFG